VVLFKGGDMRISQVPWKPVERVPRSSTPVVDEDSTHCRPRRSPSASARASAKPRVPISELSHAAHVLAVYASPPWLPIVDATLATRWWGPTLPGRDFHPLGFVAEFLFLDQLHPRTPLSQSLLGAPHDSGRSRFGTPSPRTA
jgi:hypothetical protein